MQEVDFTRPSSEDFEDWQDLEYEAWFYALAGDILDCYVEGDATATDAKILALSESGKHSMGDISNCFEYFETVAGDDHIADPELLSFRERVTDLLNLFKPAQSQD